MPLKIIRPTKVDTTLGVSFALTLLPVQNVGGVSASIRNPQVFTITSTAAVATGSEAIPVSALPCYIDAGTILSFGAVRVTVAVSANQGATSLSTLPLTSPIATSATATTLGLIFVNGCYEASVTPNFKNEDTTNYFSGIGIDQVATQVSQKISMSFYPILGDRGGELIKTAMYDKNAINKEFWVKVTFPSGESHEGAALIESASASAALQSKRQIQSSFSFLGDSYIYTPVPII